LATHVGNRQQLTIFTSVRPAPLSKNAAARKRVVDFATTFSTKATQSRSESECENDYFALRQSARRADFGARPPVKAR